MRSCKRHKNNHMKQRERGVEDEKRKGGRQTHNVAADHVSWSILFPVVHRSAIGHKGAILAVCVGHLSLPNRRVRPLQRPAYSHIMVRLLRLGKISSNFFFNLNKAMQGDVLMSKLVPLPNVCIQCMIAAVIASSPDTRRSTSLSSRPMMPEHQPTGTGTLPLSDHTHQDHLLRCRSTSWSGLE